MAEPLRNGLVAPLAVLLLGGPAPAATQVDIDTLAESIRDTGTQIVESKTCAKNMQGYYQFEARKIDQLTICVNNLDMNDPDQVWEVYAHEVTHIMQACDDAVNGRAFNDSVFPRIYRELQELNPTSVEETSLYGSWNKRQEIEARYMELLPPNQVIELFHGSLCFKQTE
jgi:hypothetical protein